MAPRKPRFRRAISGSAGLLKVGSAVATTAAGFSAAELLAVAALLGGFVGVVLWFDGVDFYRRHYFDTGAIAAANNAVRIVFVGILSWLIYAPGAAVVALVTAPPDRAALFAAERAVLGFGIGVGIWHVAMLILGVLGLYYQAVMVALCLAVLAASARHFGRVAVAGRRTVADRLAELRKRRVSPVEVGVILVAIVAAWLLLRRGLYPGGGSDYFSHYFYYYLAVLKNHGLAPNDVWYHYYYSKGGGLVFLGMLLTDPEAPALTTFPCVIFAAVAIMTLAARLAPGSLWPAAGALIYLLYYLLSFNDSGGNEFQKDHEELTALVVLTAWALCMERCAPPRPFRVMAASSAIAAAIVTQAIGALLSIYVGLFCAWSVVHRRWREMWAYGAIAAAIGGVVLAIFVLSYLQTGLASDQPFDLMLRFVDVGRLDRWGVIPQVIAGAWIRDNYRALVPPFGWEVLGELARFMRLRGLWPFLIGPIIAAIIICAADRFAPWKRARLSDQAEASLAGATAVRLAVLLLLLIGLAVLAGRAQSVSFDRLSTFFVPLLVLLAIAGGAWLLNGKPQSRGDVWTWTVLPAVLLIAVLGAWQGKDHWLRRVPRETADALRFLSGRVSVAYGYTHLNSGYLPSAINPAALAAARQLPPGTPIWSTNSESFCMVPGCLIEDVISFKMSGRLDEILGGDPELAKQRLQEAGLNYFLFSKDYRLMDLLPYSRLFAPDTIGRYLGVKWNDGSTFLLTWIGPDTTPIGPDFLKAYERRRAEPDALRWFKFDQLAPLIAAISPRMRSATQWGAADRLFTWRASAD
jgi:hypothetical protein